MKKILVVDDDPQILEIIEIRLKANNYVVITSPDGKDAILKAQKEKPDLIIMDIMMPNMPGGDAVRILMADEKTKGIPIIFLTALTANLPYEADHKGVINVDGHFLTAIPKPFKPEKLISEIKKILG
jgi:two-component system alkaline phosphatase synthesis response regulator PhoP